jgi:hypothetical protein
LPEAVPDPGKSAWTVAVKITSWPETDGLRLDLMLVDVASLFTTCGEAASSPG